MDIKKPLIIAHRGASFYAPENTVASAKLAWQQNTDALECDVHKTKDNQIVVIHDPDTLRTTSVKKIIRHENLVDIQKLDAGNWKGSQYKGENIPTLLDLLRTVPGNKKIFIEIKSSDCVELIKKIIEESSLKSHQLTFMDFDIDTIIAARKVFIQSEILWLYEFIPPLKKNNAHNTFNMIIEKALSVKADGINIEFNSFIDEALIRKIHELNMKFYTWTVNDLSEAKKLAQWGIDGIATDRPGWLKEHI